MNRNMAVAALAGFMTMSTLSAGTYKDEINAWRSQREQTLKADDGWLTLVGLYWLKEGENTLGSDPSNTVPLPASAPKHLGRIVLDHGKTTLELAPGASVTINGKPGNSRDLANDKYGKPDLVQSGSWRFFIIQRGNGFGVRVKDRESSYLREFSGLKWYPIDPAYRVTAQFTPYDAPKKVVYETKVNQPEEMISPGYVTFDWHGEKLRLEPVQEGGRLWFIFRDKTAPRETYGGGRFLYADMPQDGKVIIDFNKAYNPPCVFTPYATCPLPQPGNRLSVALRAGEMNYHSAKELLSEAH